MDIFLSFKRMNRVDYIAWSNISGFLAIIIGYLIAPFVFAIVEALMSINRWLGLLVAYLIFMVLSSLPLKFLAQRYRDAGITGWAALIGVIPLSYILLHIMMAVFPGEQYQNKYGLQPFKSSNLMVVLAVVFQLLTIGLIALLLML